MRTFTIGLHGGWGSRLITLGAAMIFAKRHGRHLRIFWDHEFYCPWERFTTTQMDLVSKDEWDVLAAEWVAACDHQVGMKLWEDGLGAAENVSDLVIAATNIPKHFGITDKEAVEEIRTCIDFSLVDRRADCALALLPSPIGVHVRRADHPDAAPGTATVGAFAVAMHEFRTHRFLVCSDDEDVKDALACRYPGRALFSGLSYGRACWPKPPPPEADPLDDLAEAILLSRCSVILGSVRSTFSRFAALYGGAPLSIVEISS